VTDRSKLESGHSGAREARTSDVQLHIGGIPRFRVCAFVLMAASVRIEESFKKRKRQDLLDRIATEV
jgi:hypothetical protein